MSGTPLAASGPRALDLARTARRPAVPATAPAWRAEVPGWRWLLAWSVAWAVVGLVVGGLILLVVRATAAGPLLQISVWFAEVVGWTALISTRAIFPLFDRLPYLVRAALQVLTLIAGALAGSVIVISMQPLFALARLETVAAVLLANVGLAVVVGIALHTYETMRRQIEASFEALRRQETLERELEIAREVQRELLPRTLPEIPGLEMAAVCIPAVGVGGDYYDVLVHAEADVSWVVADVSGKGIPAALLMAGLQASIRSTVRPDMDPAELVSRLNRQLQASTSLSRYATLFLGHYDVRGRRLAYCNAGHLPPLRVHDAGVERLEACGPPVGLLDEAAYEVRTVQLAPGDLLVLYTDGVPEALSADEDEFGMERLAERVQELRHQPAGRILDTICDDLRRWCGEQPAHDDLTLLVARVR